MKTTVNTAMKAPSCRVLVTALRMSLLLCLLGLTFESSAQSRVRREMQGTYSKEHYPMADRKALLITANEEEYNKYINTRYDEIGTFDFTYEVQTNVDIAAVSDAVKQAIANMGDEVIDFAAEYWKNHANQFDEWLENIFLKQLLEFEEEYKICVEGSPNSAEKVINFLEETFLKYKVYSTQEDAGNAFSEYKKAKADYLNKKGVPTTVQEKAEYIAFLRYTQDSIIFKASMKFYRISDFIPLIDSDDGTWETIFKHYANPLSK